MKKIFIPILFGSCIAGAAELQDAYFSYGFWEIDANNAWKIGSKEAENGTITDFSAYNAIFDGTLRTDGGAFNYWLSTSAQGAPGASSYDFGAITLQNITHAGLAIFDQRIDDAHPIGSTNVNVRGDLNVKDNTTEIALAINAGELSIGGNVKVANSTFRIGGTGTTTAPVGEWNGDSWKKVTIAGGIDISGSKFTTAVTSGSGNDNNDPAKPDLSIGGVVTMDSTSSWELNGNHSNRQDNVISVGGLSGSGTIAASMSSLDNGWSPISRTLLVFKNAAGTVSEFSGNVATNTTGVENDWFNSQRLDFVMDGAGTQIMRAKAFGTGFSQVFNGMVTVKQGSFFFSNTNQLTVWSDRSVVTLEGGRFGAVGLDSPAPGSADIGTAYLNWLDWNSAAVIQVNVGEGGNSEIYLDKGVLFTGDGDYIFDFVGDIAEGDTISGFLTWNASVGDIYAAINGIYNSNRFVFKVNGQLVEVANVAIDSATGKFSVEIAIPEPAAAAALFGAFALAFAAWRRRR